MAKQSKNVVEYYSIDIAHIFKTLLMRAWIIILCGLLTAVIGFGYSSFIIPPTYSSSIMLYVNNSSFSLGNTNFSISSSEIIAAQSLVKTYSEILKNRTTLEKVIEKAGVKYEYDELAEMITAEPANDTEIMRVTVTAEDPNEAAKIANTIAEVLPTRISEIIDGASMEVIDSAIPNYEKVAPSVTNYTIIGFLIGAVLSMIIIVVAAMLDDTIHDEEYILNTYDYPILAKIPDLLNSNGKGYGAYSQNNALK